MAFDTEASAEKVQNGEVQTWLTGAAVRWRRDLKTGAAIQRETFESPESLWAWVTDFCVPHVRTVCVAHNLGYDIRISSVLNVLPLLGWELEWCNLDRNVSSMIWRGERGTLVFADLFTWIPKPLKDIGNLLGYDKGDMPKPSDPVERWRDYCGRDAEIVARAVAELADYIDEKDLGNWQPTGAGMAYSTWRHRFMTHKVLIHDNVNVLSAERAAMHTGRAEAWRHGECKGEVWHEVDMRAAYTQIASECELPTKLKFSTGKINLRQYEDLTKWYRVLCVCEVETDVPCVPYHNGERTLWPTGRFQTVLWDTEIDLALGQGASVTISEAHMYTKHPILSEWGRWVLRIQNDKSGETPEVVRAWAKHCGRALIGRLSLRSPSWEEYGENPIGITGITWDVNQESRRARRMMHVGNQTFLETERVEGRDSLPQVTGWIMAECRVRLFLAMESAGFENIAHVDTDSVLVNSEGLARLKEAYAGQFRYMWQVKGTWAYVSVTGPRNLRVGRQRKVAGVPVKAVEKAPGQYVGERWVGVASDLEAGRAGAVTVLTGSWQVDARDPRRDDSPGVAGRTVAIRVHSGLGAPSISSSMLSSGA